MPHRPPRNIPKTEEEPIPPFPSEPRKHDKRNRVISEEFLIPDDRKQAYLDENYPFENPPKLDERRYDLHEGKKFLVRDYKLVREDGTNYIVSPYYYESGGTVLDWMPADHADDDETPIDRNA